MANNLYTAEEEPLVGNKFTFTLIPTDAFGASINFVTPSGDIAFHLNARISENVIILNSKINGEWGAEQRSPMKGFFRVGLPTKVAVMFETDAWFIDFADGTFSLKYHHRISYKKVTRFNFNACDFKEMSIWNPNQQRVEMVHSS